MILKVYHNRNVINISSIYTVYMNSIIRVYLSLRKLLLMQYLPTKLRHNMGLRVLLFEFLYRHLNS